MSFVRALFCRWCKEAVDVKPGDIPSVCPKCSRIGRWCVEPPLAALADAEYSEFDRGFLKALEEHGVRYWRPRD